MLTWNCLYKIVAIQNLSKKFDFELLLNPSFPINQIKVLRFQQEVENFKMLT